MKKPRFNGKRWLMAPIAAIAAVAAGGTVAIAGSPIGEPEQPSSFDPAYNVCRGVDPECYNEWYTAREDAVLVYSRTAGPRHGNLGDSIDPDHEDTPADLPRPYVITENHTDPSAWPLPLNETNVVQNELVRMLSEQGIAVHITEDVQAIERLSNEYRAVVFASPTRDTLWNHAAAAAGGTRLDRAREQLRKYVQGGGGFVAIHNAHGTEYTWPWYEGLLGNSNYYSHGENQEGDVVIVNDGDSSTRELPQRWGFEDEWYNLMPFPNGVNFLAVVDEATLPEGPAREDGHPGHGDFHPVTWCQYYDGGRAWITTLGHNASSFQEDAGGPGATEFQAMLVGGIRSAMGLEPFCTPAPDVAG